MTYLYILAGIWTFLALGWSVAFLSADHEVNKPSKLERLVVAAEKVGEAYENSQRKL